MTRLRFALWYARHDLFARAGRGSTLVVLANVGLLVGFSLLVFGLTEGYRRVRLDRLQRDPLALCLWAGDGSSYRVDAAALARLKANLAECFPKPGPLRGVFPFHNIDYNFFPVGPSDLAPSLSGRTLAEGDPLLESRPLQWGHGFSSANEEGLVVSPSLLQSLGASIPPPATLKLRARSGSPIDVPVLGVTRDELPLGHEFLITEAYRLYLDTVDANPRLPSATSGPVSPRWPEPRDLPPDRKALLRQRLHELKLIYPPQVRPRPNKEKVWELTALNADSPPDTYRWRILFTALHGLMAEWYGDAPGFPRVTNQLPRGKPPPDRGHDRAGIYVTELAYLQPAADAARAAGLPVNDGIIKQMEGYSHSVGVARAVLGVLVLICAVAAFANVGLIQRLRMRQKRTEFGMLRAMGISPPLLLLLCLTEAAAVWFLGAAVGALLGMPVGYAASWWLAAVPRERWLAFACPWLLAVLVPAAALAACLISTLWATWSARRSSPLESLTQG